MSASEIIFLLVGKTGVGKSAVGNAILGDNLFESSSSPDSVTKQISMKSKERKGFRLTVVDTPGFIDTTMSTDQSKVKACEDIKTAMSICPMSGKLAVIFVLKYGERHTEDNKNTLYILEHIFGKNNIWKSCIIVFTHGDCFDIDQENKIFNDYIKEQTGYFGEMFANCKYKCVLFHSKTKNIEQQEKELQTLIDCVNSLEQGFTRSKFEEAYREHNRLELEGLLTTLKVEFEMEIQSLSEKVNVIKLNLKSLDELNTVEEMILYQINRANELDAPEKIYYKENEERFLDDIRFSIMKVFQVVANKKEELRQMKMTHDFKVEMDNIKKVIMETDPRITDVFSFIKHIEENIKQKVEKIREDNLRTELLENIELSVEITTKEIINLKQKAEECEVNGTIKEIRHTLKNVSGHDEAAIETLNTLKRQSEMLMDSLKKQYQLIDKQTAKDLKSSLKTILCDINDKAETVRQSEISYNIKIEIENIQGKIIKADLSTDKIYSLIEKLDEQLRSQIKFVEKQKLREEIKENLNLSLHQAQQKLQTVKNLVQERKEMEIKTTLKSLTSNLNMVNGQGRNDSNILTQARSDITLLTSKLKQEKQNISKECFKDITLELNEIEKCIGHKEYKVKEFIAKRKLISRINEIKDAVTCVNPSESGTTESVYKYKTDLAALQKEIDACKFSVDVMQELNTSIRDCESHINQATKLIQTVQSSKFHSKFAELRHKISNLDITSETFEQEAEHIKLNLKKLHENMMKENISEELKFFEISIISMDQDVNNKCDDAQQTSVEKKLNLSLNENLKKLKTDFNIQDSEDNLMLLETQIKEANLSSVRRENLLSSLKNAREILNIRKIDIETFELESNSILKDISEANPKDENILSFLRDRLNRLIAKNQDQHRRIIEKCEHDFKELESRVNAFNEVNNEIKSLISRVQSLAMPCKKNQLEELKMEIEKIEKNVGDKIRHKKDVEILTLRTNSLIKIIEIKSKNNYWKGVGKACRYIPIVGPLIEDAVTADAKEEDRMLMINLSN